MNLSFGIEIELLIRPKPLPKMRDYLTRFGWGNQDTKKLALRRALAKLITQASIACDVTHHEQGGVTIYDAWTVADEPALDQPPGYYGLEFISRVLDTTTHWVFEISTVFRVIHQYCDILVSSGCSTHVHMSPMLPRKFTRNDVIKVMMAAAYFDDPITRMMPPDRKDNEWAKSNFLPHKAVADEIWTAYSQVSVRTWGHMFQVCQKAVLELKPDSMWQKIASLQIFRDKYLAWNIKPLQDCGTIEFRRPPGVSNAQDACHWVAFSLGFMSSALSTSLDSARSRTTIPVVPEAKRYIENGLRIFGRESLAALRPELMVEDRRPPTRMTAQQLAIIQMQKEKYRKKKSYFEEKVCSHELLILSDDHSN
ncbi:hypothetical protein BGZ63DRAFT_407578 [Mariannaea sp. PMI_226]|nr:hypothetical protein BGZ63DRAFT_407578 [Mariannaea sp. PMI_226]